MIKVLKLKDLKKKTISQIHSLKNTHWKSNIKSQQKWFKENIKKDDLHIVLLKEKIIGYNLLRKRSLDILNLKNKKLKKHTYYYFDTLIVDQKYRNLKYGLKILNECKKIYKKKKIPLILMCKKRVINFYKKSGWKILDKKIVSFRDHNFTTNVMIYCTQIFFNKVIKNNKLFAYIKK